MIKTLTETTYNNLIAYAKKLIGNKPHFLLTAYDLVHEAIAMNANDPKRIILTTYQDELNRSAGAIAFNEKISGRHKQEIAHTQVHEKICPHCKDSLPHGSYYTRIDKKNGRVLLSDVCISCAVKRSITYYQQVKDTPQFKAYRQFYNPVKLSKEKKYRREKLKKKILPGKKRCIKCKRSLTSKDYGLRYIKREKKYTLSSRCLSCIAEKSRAYYQLNKDKEEFKKAQQKIRKRRWQTIKNNERVATMIRHKKNKHYKQKISTAQGQKDAQAHRRKRYLAVRKKMQDDPEYAERILALQRKNTAAYKKRKRAALGLPDPQPRVIKKRRL